MDPQRLRGLLEAEGVVSSDLFCTVHALDVERIAVIYSSHPTPERLGGWQPYEQGVVGHAARIGEPYIVDDVNSLPGYLGIYPGVVAEMAIPVESEGNPMAVINFESTEESFFSGREREFMNLASRITSYFEFKETRRDVGALLVPETSLVIGRSEERLQVEVSAISDALMSSLARDPSLLHDLNPRKFEELVGRILEDLGYAVTLTQFQKDGGYDMLAEARMPTGRVLTLVECKKWSPARPVGVEIVRNLYGVLATEGATNAMVVTTSHFTRGARRLEDTVKYRMNLSDYQSIVQWLTRYRPSEERVEPGVWSI
jgi:HJR/Mrr/RecB family endonuclease